MADKYCSCEKCISCCKNLPGIFMPEEIEPAAKFMDITLNDFLQKYCVVGWKKKIEINGQSFEEIKFVYPAKVGFGGTMENFGYPFKKADCIFLKDNRCDINGVKPFECRESFGCKYVEINGLRPRDIALLAWHKAMQEKELPKEIFEFIEKAPMKEESEWEIMGNVLGEILR